VSAGLLYQVSRCSCSVTVATAEGTWLLPGWLCLQQQLRSIGLPAKFDCACFFDRKSRAVGRHIVEPADAHKMRRQCHACCRSSSSQACHRQRWVGRVATAAWQA
jgi:hypothetical protein